MQLRRVSAWFFFIVLAVLGANAMFLVMITRAYDAVVSEQQHRQLALELANELQQETEQQGRLVRAFTATGETRYLQYYYDLLDFRQGEKALPAGYDPASYWDDVIAGRKAHAVPQGGIRRSVRDTMRMQGFSATELQGFQRVLDATSAMNKLEQRAFAATQGLYNPDTDEFVSDGPARLDYAGQLVHSETYNALKADLSTAVSSLMSLTDQRTSAEVAAARSAMEQWIWMSLVSMATTIVLTVLALRAIRRNLLTPIHHLGSGADRLASGDYAARTGVVRGFDEMTTLGRTLDSMANAIEGDIRQRHTVQAELVAARTQAEDATRAKSSFLANMSHEIRTPMNAILGMAYLALQTDLSARQRDYLGKIHQAARLLLGIINDILDFSKVEAGRLELERGRFLVEEVAGQSLSLLSHRAQEKDLELLLEIADARLLRESGAFMGDALRLGQVLTNLLSNAVKFTHHGHVKLLITLDDVDADGRVLHFEVRDTGVGMSATQINMLFREFTQADGSTTRQYGGTGLGLTISKRIVQLMGGRIWVQSTPGGGSSFHFTARLDQAAPLPTDPEPGLGAESVRAIVVDDQAEAVQALTRLLGALGVGSGQGGRLDASTSGVSALSQIEHADQAGMPYDIVMVDWAMPSFSGAAVLEAVRNRQGDGPGPVIVVVSAYDTDAVRDAARALGARFFLPKPVLPDGLRRVLRRNETGFAEERGVHVEPVPTVQLNGFHILLVEDNPVNQQLAKELLVCKGILVDIAANGQECLDFVERHRPGHYDAILMDLQMPVMDGYEATRRLRLDARQSGLPIIAMTAHAMPDERERCLLLGMNGHISKPIEPEILYATLSGTFGRQNADLSISSRSSTNAGSGGSEGAAAVYALAGLDMHAGLHYANGKADLYGRLVRQFAKDHAGFAARTLSLVAGSHWHESERHAHTLTGVAASLGAGELRAQAIQLEKALMAREITGVRRALAPIEESFCKIDAALQTLPDDVDDMTAPGSGHESATWPDLDWLPMLRQLLEQGDNEARELWNARLPELEADGPKHAVKKVSQLLAQYDFDAVLQLLPQPERRQGN